MPDLYEKLIRPLMFRLPAETAHELGITALRYGLAPKAGSNTALGPVERFGLRFKSPIGVAAGFDKNGVAVNQLAALGFGFVEVGTVTLRSQKGNERPRMFRLPNDDALVNRLGFNNEGAKAVSERLNKVGRICPIGVNIGKNKDVPNDEAVENYLRALELVHPVADYIAVNVSSPNTPNLRDLQQQNELEALVSSLQIRNREIGEKPLLVKIAPDLTEHEIEMIVDVCVKNGVAGIIATNTTVSREGLKTSQLEIARVGGGGLSGRPLSKRANEVIALVHDLAGGKLQIVGVGGIFSARDAFEKIVAGASLIQAYTGFVYTGPLFAQTINDGLARILRELGFESIDEAVGSGSK
jgi:dihydroorotate dehydrogenase